MMCGHAAAADRFLAGFEQLSEAARSRLVLENDDRVFGFGEAVTVAERAGVPLVFDIHHHRCHDPDGIDDREALELALDSWPTQVTPKIHFSSPRLDMSEKRRRMGRRVERTPVLPDPRLHADLIDPAAFEAFLGHTALGLNFDVMLEAKGKDLALLRLREQLRDDLDCFRWQSSRVH